jgi:hypothetical protein
MQEGPHPSTGYPARREQCDFGCSSSLTEFRAIASGSAAVLNALGLCLLVCCSASAGDIQSASPSQTNAPSLVNSEEKTWSFGVSVYGYLVPESHDYAQPTLTADHGMLHLEARYNYEELKTGSFWLGCNFGGGKNLEWEFTPMLGGVFGHQTGVAPGYKGSLRWWKLDLFSEGEYVFDTGDSSESFFYNWSELTLAPVDWLKFGLVTQRTRAYRSDREIQRGLLAGIMLKRVDFTVYVFNPDDSRPIVVLGAAFHF